MTMQAVINEVSQRLGQEVELYRQLLEVVSEERDILLEGDHQRLMSTTERKLSQFVRNWQLCRKAAAN
jgi:hypothetical protein